MKKVLKFSWIILLTLLMGGCGGGSSNSGSAVVPKTATVTVVNNASLPAGTPPFSFTPAAVSAGTMVTWSNQSSAPHCIMWDAQTPATSPAPGANLAVFAAGASSTVWQAPAVTGQTTYNYHCCIHGVKMNGTITVTP